MNESRLTTLAQLRRFSRALERSSSSADEDLSATRTSARCSTLWLPGLKRADKGLVLRYLMRTTGYSRPQLARLMRA